MPIAELTAPSLASIMRGSPVEKLTARLAMLTTSTRTAIPLTARPLTRARTDWAAGGTLLRASEVTTSQPSARSR